MNIVESLLSFVCYHSLRWPGGYSVSFFARGERIVGNRNSGEEDVTVRYHTKRRHRKARLWYNQEERLETLDSNLKQFQTETSKAYGEMAVELTMVKGLTEDAVKRLASLKDRLEDRFERVDTRLDGMDAHLESVDGRLGRLENLLVQVLVRLPER